MEILKGLHLTQTEKKHIAHLIEIKVFEAKINNRKNYFIKDLGAGKYSVEIAENKTAWCESIPKLSSSNYIIQL